MSFLCPNASTLSRRFRAPVGVACAVVLSVAVGCTMPPPVDDGGGGGMTGGNADTVTATIINIKTNFGISVLEPVPLTVLYTVTGTPDSISGFYVPVADNNDNAAAIGDRVITDALLPAGADQAFSFNPSISGVGFFRVGLVIISNAQETTVESDAVIQVQGPPSPTFVQPAVAITEVMADDLVSISFDAGDPEGDVQWRVFYLSDGDDRTALPDQLGTEIAIGSGNIGQVEFDTAGLLPGDYELGVSASDSGVSVAGTVVAGDLDRIVTVPSGTEVGPIVRIIG